MRTTFRRTTVLLFVGALLTVLAPSATADSQTVDGKGHLTKMFVNNGDKGVTVKLFGLEEPCGGTQYFNVQIKWGDKEAYEVDGGCFGITWAYGLFYFPDRTDDESGKAKECDGLKVTHNAEKTFLKVYVPRTCMPKANNKVKVQAIGYNFGHLNGGSAGPTKLLPRG